MRPKATTIPPNSTHIPLRLHKDPAAVHSRPCLFSIVIQVSQLFAQRIRSSPTLPCRVQIHPPSVVTTPGEFSIRHQHSVHSASAHASAFSPLHCVLTIHASNAPCSRSPCRPQSATPPSCRRSAKLRLHANTQAPTGINAPCTRPLPYAPLPLAMATATQQLAHTDTTHMQHLFAIAPSTRPPPPTPPCPCTPACARPPSNVPPGTHGSSTPRACTRHKPAAPPPPRCPPPASHTVG